jgi:hypothetical protein
VQAFPKGESNLMGLREHIVQRVRCALGRHVPDRRRVKEDAYGIYRGKCRGCGKPMSRSQKGWTLDEK